MPAPKQTDPQFKLRMPKALKDDLDAAVLQSGRSLNAEIVYRLEKSFPQELPHGTQLAHLVRDADAVRAYDLLKEVMSIIAGTGLAVLPLEDDE